MNCFIHPQQTAVGACVSCGKGVCVICLNKEGGRIYCDACARRRPTVVDAFTGAAQTFDRAASLVSTRNRYLAAILAIFTGSFGLHKFYLGQIGWGIVYFLFSWTLIPGFAGVVEGLLYLLSSDEAFAHRYGGTPFLTVSPPTYRTFARARSAAPATLRTPEEQERMILQLASARQGVLSVAEIVAESGLSIEKVETRLAHLSAKNVTRVEIDDNGRIFYLFPDFQRPFLP
jgi:TM2 domain-containing membrane protein YozV